MSRKKALFEKAFANFWRHFAHVILLAGKFGFFKLLSALELRLGKLTKLFPHGILPSALGSGTDPRP